MENKNDWKFEISSGYDGYRNIHTNVWIYKEDYDKRFKPKTVEKIVADIRNKMGYIANLLSLLEIEDKDDYTRERIKELIPKSKDSIEWLRNIKIEDYDTN